jgi:uncharacterized radical SAM superfamily protein
VRTTRPRTYDHAAILRDHLAGMSAPQIMAAHGCSRMTVSRALIPVIGKRQGTPERVTREEFIRLLDEWRTISAVARAIGCQRTAAQFRAERMGLR